MWRGGALLRFCLHTTDEQLQEEDILPLVPFKHCLSDTVFASNALITDIVFDKTDKQDHSTFSQMPGLLRNKPHNEELPCIYLVPSEWNGQVVIWLDPAGKACLWHEQGKLQPGIQRLLDNGSAVVGVDLLMQGEFVPDGKAPERTRRVELDRESAAYTLNGFARIMVLANSPREM